MVPELLDASKPIPDAALVVVKELIKQRETLLAANETPRIEAVQGSFVSPVSKFLPSESKHCKFTMLKPPKGTPPAPSRMPPLTGCSSAPALACRPSAAVYLRHFILYMGCAQTRLPARHSASA